MWEWYKLFLNHLQLYIMHRCVQNVSSVNNIYDILLCRHQANYQLDQWRETNENSYKLCIFNVTKVYKTNMKTLLLIVVKNRNNPAILRYEFMFGENSMKIFWDAKKQEWRWIFSLLKKVSVTGFFELINEEANLRI